MRLSTLLSSLEDKSLYATSDELVNNDYFIGLEIELEKATRLAHPTITKTFDSYFWDVGADGSLREGAEVKFNRPLKGANIIKALNLFEEGIEKASKMNIHPVLSERTSMHAHLDARDMDLEEINNFILTYMLVEGVLFNYVGYHRIKNNYCRPLIGSDFNNVLLRMIEAVESDSSNSLYLMRINEYSDKYSALNTKSLSTFGSFEFRQHPGSYKKGEMLEWVNIILSIKAFIKQGNTINNIMQLSYTDVMNIIFGEKLFNILDKEGSKRLFETNRHAVKEIVNIAELTDKTHSILRKSSKAKLSNNIIYRYAMKTGVL